MSTTAAQAPATLQCWVGLRRQRGAAMWAASAGAATADDAASGAGCARFALISYAPFSWRTAPPLSLRCFSFCSIARSASSSALAVFDRFVTPPALPDSDRVMLPPQRGQVITPALAAS